jgi:hypothetical protein
MIGGSNGKKTHARAAQSRDPASPAAPRPRSPAPRTSAATNALRFSGSMIQQQSVSNRFSRYSSSSASFDMRGRVRHAERERGSQQGREADLGVGVPKAP